VSINREPRNNRAGCNADNDKYEVLRRESLTGRPMTTKSTLPVVRRLLDRQDGQPNSDRCWRISTGMQSRLMVIETTSLGAIEAAHSSKVFWTDALNFGRQAISV
jgi:hypothetical protein